MIQANSAASSPTLLLWLLWLLSGAAPAAHAESRSRAPGRDGELRPGAFCEALLEGAEAGASPSLELPPANRLISYLSWLLSENLLSTEGLQSIQLALVNRGELVPPFSGIPPGALSSSQQIHRGAIEGLLQESAALSERNQKELKEGLLGWLSETLAQRAHVRVRREETREETQSAFHRMIFQPIPPGRFWWEEHRVSIEIKHRFELMETDVTQFMWVELMGENPSHFRKGMDSIFIASHGRNVELLPDHPVENITWWSAAVFANRLSEERGFAPVYDLSSITWEPRTRAESGSLRPLDPEARKLVKINAPDGDVYRAKGYRLPTQAEWEYVLRDAGNSSGAYPQEVSEQGLLERAWLKPPPPFGTRAVATTAKTFRVNGRDFHDLLGNVNKWSHDWFRWGEFDGYFLERLATLRGGSWFTAVSALNVKCLSNFSPGHSNGGTGLRLVRTLD